MTRGNNLTAVNYQFPRPFIESLDMVLIAWRRRGFEGGRRDVLEALISYVFFIHREDDEPFDFPPKKLIDMEFQKSASPGRESLEFDPTPFISSVAGYDPSAWSA